VENHERARKAVASLPVSPITANAATHVHCKCRHGTCV
jgi:hypothetical protein